MIYAHNKSNVSLVFSENTLKKRHYLIRRNIMAQKTRTVYFVRGGTKDGAYLTKRVRGAATNPLKYAWTPYKAKIVEMSYDVARKLAQRYGGRTIKRVYSGKNVVAEVVVGA